MKAKRESIRRLREPDSASAVAPSRSSRSFSLKSPIRDATGSLLVVARTRMPAVSGRLTPIVKVLGAEYVLLVLAWLPVAVTDLRTTKDQLVHTETRL